MFTQNMLTLYTTNGFSNRLVWPIKFLLLIFTPAHVVAMKDAQKKNQAPYVEGHMLTKTITFCWYWITASWITWFAWLFAFFFKTGWRKKPATEIDDTENIWLDALHDFFRSRFWWWWIENLTVGVGKGRTPMGKKPNLVWI